VSVWILNGTSEQLQCHSGWKKQDRRQITNTDATKTKDNPEKANDTKQN